MAYYPSDNPTSLVAWFRMGVGITESGGLASAWADQSGNGNNLLQATGTNQPAYAAGVLTFDGLDNFMKCVAFTLNQPTQVSMLVEQITWTNNDRFYDGNANATGFMNQRLASPDIAIGAGLAIVANNSEATLGSFHAITALFSGASSSVLVDSGTPTTGNPGTNNMGGFTLGQGGGGAFPSNIAVKEIIIRNVDDATIRANDHQYLIDLNAAVTPVAAFSGTPTSGEPPLSVTFTDASTNSPFAWLWDFGDGDTSTSQNPTHNYVAAGTYTVTLTASNYAGSDSEIKTNYITVTSSTDTHDGGKRKRKRHKHYEDIESFEAANKRLEAIRQALGWQPASIEQVLETPLQEEVEELVEPYTERLESGAPRIDYEALRKDEALKAKLTAIFEAERKRLEAIAIEQDDEEVILLALH